MSVIEKCKGKIKIDMKNKRIDKLNFLEYLTYKVLDFLLIVH